MKEVTTKLRSLEPKAILRQDAPESLLKCIDKAVIKQCQDGESLFGAILPYDISKEWFGESGWSDIRKYCEERLGDDVLAPCFLFDVLLQTFQPGDKAGVWLGKNIVQSLEPNLEFDDDGLLIGPQDYIKFEKEGVLTPDHFMFYERFMPGVGVSGGFLDVLLARNRNYGSTRFGLAIQADRILARKYYRTSNTRAYIRGPRGLELKEIQNPRFPEDPKGTVTEHRAVENATSQRLFPVERLEVMWSRRKGIKTIQLEELVSPPSTQQLLSSLIQNRYAHAIWDPKSMCFKHFDGAIRGYAPKNYSKRLETDLKKHMQRSESYKKLFRIDSTLDLSIWSDLLTRYYDQNELVLEYLGGAK